MVQEIELSCAVKDFWLHINSHRTVLKVQQLLMCPVAVVFYYPDQKNCSVHTIPDLFLEFLYHL